VVGWLYEGADRRIPAIARELIASGEPRISPVVELELTYLHEVGKVTEPASAPLRALRRAIGLEVADLPAAALIGAAVELSWTRDPFDRLIAAQAVAADVPLITADRTMLANLPQAVWE
jgi:PIN domain nuclease of toxin-antitoxin system